MMTYSRMSIETVIDQSIEEKMIIEKIQIIKIDEGIKTILKDYHKK